MKVTNFGFFCASCHFSAETCVISEMFFISVMLQTLSQIHFCFIYEARFNSTNLLEWTFVKSTNKCSMIVGLLNSKSLGVIALTASQFLKLLNKSGGSKASTNGCYMWLRAAVHSLASKRIRTNSQNRMDQMKSGNLTTTQHKSPATVSALRNPAHLRAGLEVNQFSKWLLAQW